jgi:hypothetical protein
MTLGNLRANGVRSLAVQCHKCNDETVITVDRWPGRVVLEMPAELAASGRN